MGRAQHAVTQKRTTARLIESARSSMDGMFIRQTINGIEESQISTEGRNATAPLSEYTIRHGATVALQFEQPTVLRSY